MNDDLLQIKTDLTEAKEKLVKVSADVDALHAKINDVDAKTDEKAPVEEPV